MVIVSSRYSPLWTYGVYAVSILSYMSFYFVAGYFEYLFYKGVFGDTHHKKFGNSTKTRLRAIGYYSIMIILAMIFVLGVGVLPYVFFEVSV